MPPQGGALQGTALVCCRFIVPGAGAGYWPSRASVQLTTIAPVRGEMTEASKATPLPGAVLRWHWDAPDATAPATTTVSDATGHFLLTRPARAASRLVQTPSYWADTVAVPVTDAPYLRVALRAGQELGEVIVNYRPD